MHHSYLDQFAYRSSLIHCLDPRGKLFALFAFIFFVVSVPPPYFLPLIPCLIYPLWLGGLSGVPFSFLFRHLLWVSPFLFPLFILECFSAPSLLAAFLISLHLVLKFGLTVGAVLLTMATTPFFRILKALEWFRLPSVFLLQLSFLYRYLFLVVEEGERMLRARRVRSFGQKKGLFYSAAALVGTLFLRSLWRSEKVVQAMRARGFQGQVRLSTPLKWQREDTFFLALFLVYLSFLGWMAL